MLQICTRLLNQHLFCSYCLVYLIDQDWEALRLCKDTGIGIIDIQAVHILLEVFLKVDKHRLQTNVLK